MSREDFVVSVQKKDGSVSAEHADGTRITCVYQEKPKRQGGQIYPILGFIKLQLTITVVKMIYFGCLCFFVVMQQDKVSAVNASTKSECSSGQDSVEEKEQTQDGGDDEEEADKANGDEDFCSSLKTTDDFTEEKECDENELGHDEEEKKVVTEETVTRKSPGERKKRKARERVVMVEKEGCATVVMYPERHMARVFFADGTVITGNNQGVYQVNRGSCCFHP